MPANTIDEVIASLNNIIADCKTKGSRLGYFASLYLKVTVAVKEGINSGRFPNGPQMEKLDVTFANRYLDAYDLWHKGQKTTASWAIAFEQAEKSSVLVLQHLLLGINAHINLDLGIAAVETMGDQPIAALKTNFDSINEVISSLTNQVLSELGQVSPLLSLLGLHASNENFALIQFSIDNARDGAWCFAEDLSQATGDERNKLIVGRDVTISKLGQALVRTRGLISFTIWLVHLFEMKNVGAVIRILDEYRKRKIVISKH